MTDEAPVAESTTPAEKTDGRRTRPDTVVARDAQVLDWMKAQVDENGAPKGVTRAAIVEGTGLEPKQVYLSLYRLKRDSKITGGGAGGSRSWTVATEAAPAEVVPA